MDDRETTKRVSSASPAVAVATSVAATPAAVASSVAATIAAIAAIAAIASSVAAAVPPSLISWLADRRMIASMMGRVGGVDWSRDVLHEDLSH